ncbi:ribonuclease H-like domain-containing protein [Sedimentibacter sp. zth1]|uniref:ribonuclease H-like domain-containing protein n=1 Tax=Sedimentibacter sp. zth1 TaxID=2816908 RepID=UPI001A922729|nr:ribonuclease H-like domain-containing protein [Sedimentibacter sp. zth1]QSX07098.1 ribonuclease H-like domain-containing protein [Sedimentibacter sp. zth1]
MISKKIIEDYNLNNKFIEEIFNDSVYLDIETSGLSAVTSEIVSITFLIVENNKKIIYQTFSINEQEELESLFFLMSKIYTKKYIITYNGKSFDITYLNKKFEKYNIDFNLNNLHSIDLYKDMLNFKNKINIANNKLKTVEKYFKIFREDTLSGKDVITLYEAYKIHKKDEHRDLILLHNFEDVYYLPIIFDNILNSYDKIFYSKTLGILKVNKKDISISNKAIKIKFLNITDYKLDYNSNKLCYKLNFKSQTSITKLDILISLYKSDSDNYILFIDNNEIKLMNFNTLPNLKDNIVPIVINGTLLFENVCSIIEKALKDI